MALLKGYSRLQGFCEDYSTNAFLTLLELQEEDLLALRQTVLDKYFDS